MKRLGLRSLSPADLLAILSAETQEQELQILPACTQLVSERGINALGDLSFSDLNRVRPFGVEEGSKLLAAIELGRRSGLSGKGVRNAIGSPKDVFQRFSWLKDEKREFFCLLLLDIKNGILAERVVHIGTLSMSVVGAKEVFREAIREGAAGIIAVHNHPSGDPAPSQEDFEVTEKLAQAGELLDLPILDHIIIGHNGYASMKELHYL